MRMATLNRFRIPAAVVVVLGGMLSAFLVLKQVQTLARAEADFNGKHYVFIIEDRGRWTGPIRGPEVRGIIRSERGEEYFAIGDGRSSTESAEIVVDHAARRVLFITDFETVERNFDHL
jgi:hypothetical protein